MKDLKIRNKDILLKSIDFLSFCAILGFYILTDNSLNQLPIIGWGNILFSIILVIKAKNNQNLLFLMMLIGFINISLSHMDLINFGIEVATWQVPLRMTDVNVINAKNILLFLSVFNMFIDFRRENNNEYVEIQRLSNTLISFIGISVMVLLLLYNLLAFISMSDGGYISNSNPFYEYIVVIYIVVWYFSGNLNLHDKLLKAYSFMYIFQSFFFGDRSAAFMMIILFVLLNFKKISIGKLTLAAVLAVLFSNFIAIQRDYSDLSVMEKLVDFSQRGLYSDTVSFAYYSSITLTALPNLIPSGFNLRLLSQFIISIFLGTGRVEVSSLTVFARDNFSVLFNRGGGIYPSHFYVYLGVIGVIVSAVILGIIVRYLFRKNTTINQLYQILIVTFSLRWYLYNPITLYRSVMVIFTVLFFGTVLIHNLFFKHLKNKKLGV